MVRENEFMQAFQKWVKDFEDFVRTKGKVKPGKWRAYGYKPPTNLWKEAKTGIRSWMLRLASRRKTLLRKNKKNWV